MQAEARAALASCLEGLQFQRLSSAEGEDDPYFVNFLPLQLHSKPAWWLSPGTTMVVTLFDHQHSRRQREQTALRERALLELLVRLMNSTACQWNAYYHEFWQPELIQRLRFVDHPRDNKLYADQRTLLETRELPTFVLNGGGAKVLTTEQEELLGRVYYSSQRRQVTLKIGLRLTDCKVDKPFMASLRSLLERVAASKRDDPVVFPVKFEISTLWFGSNAFEMPFDMDAIESLASMPGLCVQNSLTYNNESLQRQWTKPLQHFAPQVLLHPSLRRLSLTWIRTSATHVRSICSAARVSSNMQDLSLRRGYTVADPSDFDLIWREKNVIWAWIAFGILHKDSCSALSRLNLTKMDASTQSLEIVSRILSSPHPGRELVRVIAPDQKAAIDKDEERLPDGKKLFVSLRAKSKLRRKPREESNCLSTALNKCVTEEMQWEVLVRIRKWTCVLVPAYGIAWVSDESIIAQTEEESTITRGNMAQSRSSIKELEWNEADPVHVDHIIPMIGHSLEFLSVKLATLSSEILENVLNSCPNLKLLRFCASDPASSAVLPILKAYHENRCQIERLRIGLIDRQCYIEEVAQLLADPSAKALLQLSIEFQLDDLASLDYLVAACHTNRTLELLRVHVHDGDHVFEQVKFALDKFNNQTLAIHTPSAIKWAFLSVIRHRRTHNTANALQRFDSLIISRIFSFAGAPIRRNISLIQVS